MMEECIVRKGKRGGLYRFHGVEVELWGTELSSEGSKESVGSGRQEVNAAVHPQTAEAGSSDGEGGGRWY
jgi:hypothetical protein